MVFPSLEEFSAVCGDPHSQGFGIVNKAEVDFFFFEALLLFQSDQSDLELITD